MFASCIGLDWAVFYVPVHILQQVRSTFKHFKLLSLAAALYMIMSEPGWHQGILDSGHALVDLHSLRHSAGGLPTNSADGTHLRWSLRCLASAAISGSTESPYIPMNIMTVTQGSPQTQLAYQARCILLADRTNGRAYATVLRLSVVCNVMYCG